MAIRVSVEEASRRRDPVDAAASEAKRTGTLAWPLIGILAGEPLWGLVMGVFAAGAADRRTGFSLS